MNEPRCYSLTELMTAWQQALAELVTEHQRALSEQVELAEYHRNRADQLERECERLSRANRLAGVFPAEEMEL